MRILLCKGQFMGPISGADETLITYATQLRLAGHSPSLLLMYQHASDDHYYLRLKRAGVPVDAITSAGISTSFGAGRKLASILLQALPSSQLIVRKNARKISSGIAGRYLQKCRDYFARCGADVVHVITPDPSAMVMIRAAYEANIPVLYQELGTPYHPPAFAAYYEQFTSVLPLCSGVAALSPHLARECSTQLHNAAPFSVLPIMTEDLYADEPPSRNTADGVVFGFAARLEHLKGPLVLVEAFAHVARTFPRSLLRMAGVGSQRQKVVASAKALASAGQCDLVGAYTGLEEKKAFLRSLDVLVLPSLTEGTPNSIVEAMACGLPVVASAVGGVVDVVTAETGILVPPENPAALADAMLRLASDRELRARMGRAARKRYEEFFSPEAVLPLMLNTYGEIAGRRRRGHEMVGRGSGVELHPWTVETPF